MKHYFQNRTTVILLFMLLLAACSKDVSVNVNNEASTQTDTNSSAEKYDLPDMTDKLEGGRKVITPKNVNDLSVLKYYGQGYLSHFAISPGGDSLAVTTASGVYIYSLPEFREKYFFSVLDAGEVIFSPDAKMISVSLYGGRQPYTPDVISVWDVTTEKELWNTPIDGFLADFIFTPDSKMLTAILDKQEGWFIQRWDSLSGKELPSTMDLSGVTIKGDRYFFSIDGSKVAFLDEAKLHLVDLQTGEESTSPILKHLFGGYREVSLSSDLKYIVISQDDEYRVSLWDIQTGEQLWVNFSEYGAIYVVEFSPDGQLVASGGEYGKIFIWDTLSGSLLHVLQNDYEEGTIFQVIFYSEGQDLAFETNNEILLWDVGTGERIGGMKNPTLGCTLGAMSPDGNLVATACNSSKIRVWDTNTGTLVWEEELSAEPSCGMEELKFSPDGEELFVYTCNSDDNFWVFDSKNGDELHRWVVGFDDKTTFLNGCTVQITYKGLEDMKSGKLIFALEEEDYFGFNLSWALTQDCKMFVLNKSFSLDRLDEEKNSFRLWDARSGELKIQEQGKTYWPFTFSPNGQILAGVSDENHYIVLWDTMSGERIRTLSINGTISELIFSPNAQFLAGVSDEDQSIIFWNSRTGEKIQTISLNGLIDGLFFSPDDQKIITRTEEVIYPYRSKPGEFSLWNIKNGKLTCKFNDSASDKGLFTIFSPDRKILATYDYSDNLMLWDTSNCTLLRDMETEVVSASFSDDGRFLLTGEGDGLVKLWGIP